MIRDMKKVYVTLSILIILTSLLLTGCNIVEKLFINDLMPKRVEKAKKTSINESKLNSTNKYNANNTNNTNNNNNTKSTNNNTDNRLNQINNINKEELSSKPNQGEYNIKLFFSNKDATGFVQEKRTINKVSGLAKETLIELIKGPKNNKNTVQTIPKGTEILNVIIKDGICYANFSKELQKNHPGGSTGEYMTVYSIVKTLCQFSTINKVQILIEGKVVPTLAGHLDISKPLENSFVKNPT